MYEILFSYSGWSFFFSLLVLLFKKETSAQVFSCKFFEISEKTFFKEQLRAAAYMTSEFTSTERKHFESWQ